MRLDDLDPSDNVRDLGSGGGGGGGGLNPLMLLPLLLGRGKMGCGTIALLLVVGIGYLFMSGGGGMLSGGGAPAVQQAPSAGSGATVCTPERLFSCRVLESTEHTWEQIFKAQGGSYTPATLNFYTGGANSACGYASSAAGPYYCPPNHGVYLDTSFFDELANKLGAKGDFAQAYVIAHEIGHHIQTLTGTSAKVNAEQQRASSAEGNALSVRLELQADCYAGVWAGRNKDRMEPGDLEEGMTAAQAIGDDTLQQQSQGRVVPESFTHGTSAQRMKWLRRGLDTGDPAACDTFSGAI
jgi:predicted metalloprotease